MVSQVLTQEEYNQWQSNHERAENSLERREEKLYESYLNLERELELLGATGIEDRSII